LRHSGVENEKLFLGGKYIEHTEDYLENNYHLKDYLLFENGKLSSKKLLGS
jgi:hypothetical protein